MVTFLLIILFSVLASVESFAYGLYEIKVNTNKAGGITLIILSFIRTGISFYCLLDNLVLKMALLHVHFASQVCIG